MKDYVMSKNYAKTFKRLAILFVILAVVTAVGIPLSLSQQISDAAALEKEQAAAELQQQAEPAADVRNGDGHDGHDGHEKDNEEAWKSRITPLGALNYAVIGAAIVLWSVLVLAYWLNVTAWLYKSAVSEGMNRSLWAVLGAFTNIFAVLAFCIVRDRPARARA